jgi:hypothetical protein
MIGGVIVVARTSPTLLYYRESPGENDGVEIVENPDCSDAATTGHCYYSQQN